MASVRTLSKNCSTSAYRFMWHHWHVIKTVFDIGHKIYVHVCCIISNNEQFVIVRGFSLQALEWGTCLTFSNCLFVLFLVLYCFAKECQLHLTIIDCCLCQLEKDNPKVNAIYVMRGSIEGMVIKLYSMLWQIKNYRALDTVHYLRCQDKCSTAACSRGWADTQTHTDAEHHNTFSAR